MKTCIPVDDRREWIQFLGSSDFSKSFFVPSHYRQILGVPLMCFRVTWTEFSSSLESTLGCRPVPVIKQVHGRQRGVCLGEIVIPFQRLRGQTFRGAQSVSWWERV